ncbi:hypothetical protein B0H14DRAFT_2596181 [Mycena olivaceomarginata]|nr:hypothetical protein B0H14DRAFT_2596181 [Mycena olivaceomarginata]
MQLKFTVFIITALAAAMANGTAFQEERAACTSTIGGLHSMGPQRSFLQQHWSRSSVLHLRVNYLVTYEGIGLNREEMAWIFVRMNIPGHIPNKKNYSVGKKNSPAPSSYSDRIHREPRCGEPDEDSLRSLGKILVFDDICLRRSSLCRLIGYHEYVLRAELCTEHTNPFVRLKDEVSLVIAGCLTWNLSSGVPGASLPFPPCQRVKNADGPNGLDVDIGLTELWTLGVFIFS